MKPVNEERLGKTLECIQTYQREYGRTPAYRHIMRECGHSSLSMVSSDVERLKGRGLLETDTESKWRRIRIPARLETGETEAVPLVGNVACGEPMLAVENIELTAALPVEIFGHGRHMMLRAAGRSMIKRGIFPDDILVIRCQQAAEIGEIVVARVDKGYATAKILAKDSKGYYLKPANDSLLENGEPEFRDIRPETDWEILGVVEKVIHEPLKEVF